jgi:hypothetical protein
MIDRQHGKLVIECDACDETFQGDNDNWQEVWPAAKRDGWKTRKVGDDWLHMCPKPRCQKP